MTNNNDPCPSCAEKDAHLLATQESWRLQAKSADEDIAKLRAEIERLNKAIAKKGEIIERLKKRIYNNLPGLVEVNHGA